MWPENLFMCSAQQGCSCALTPALLRGVNRRGALQSLVSEEQTLQITQEIYRWVRMRVNLSQVSKSMALSGYIQPGLQRFDRILVHGHCLLLSGHIQPLLSCATVQWIHNIWFLLCLKQPHQCLNERRCWWAALEGWHWKDSTAFPLIALALSEQPVRSQWHEDGICWLEFIDTTH